jgi:outer membrane protein
MNVKLFATMLLMFLAVHYTQAQQKFGHINSGNLLEMMPEVNQAEQNLLSFREGLMSDFQSKVERFQRKYESLAQAVQSGELSQRDQQIRTQELEMEQEELVEMEREIQQKVSNKREQLLSPILAKVDEAITAVGKEENFSFIFDTSIGATLYATESLDISEKVKKKLGIKDQPKEND